jgi:hypothetical protein
VRTTNPKSKVIRKQFQSRTIFYSDSRKCCGNGLTEISEIWNYNSERNCEASLCFRSAVRLWLFLISARDLLDFYSLKGLKTTRV